jgi:hypothetical protein
MQLFFSKGDQLDISQMGQIMFCQERTIVQVFIYEKKLKTEKTNLKKRYIVFRVSESINLSYL